MTAVWGWGQTAAYEVISTTAVATSGTTPTGSSATYFQTYNTVKQITSGNSATLTLSGYAGFKITKITLEMRSNTSSGAGTLGVVAGSTTIASISPAVAFNSAFWYGAWSTTYVDVVKVPTAYEITTGENVVITIAATVNSLYIQKYTIEYEPAPSGDHTITVTQATGGTITPGTSGVNDGDDISFTATPDACYNFTNWVVDGLNAGNTNPYTFTNVTSNHTITAVYTQKTYNIAATAGANGSISPSGTTSVNCGDNQTYTITPDSGYTVDEVLVDGVSVGAVTSYTFNNVTSAHAIAATFKVYTGPCHTEGFSNIGNSSSYGTINWNGEGGAWNATDAREDQIINGKAITIRNGVLTSPQFADGVGSITLTAKFAFTESSGDLTIKVNGNPVGSILFSEMNGATPVTKTISNINVGGNVVITISSGGARYTIDDLNWACYTAAPQAPVITSPLTQSSEYGAAASYTITADYLPTSFSATNLPAGLSINTGTGLISGTVTADVDNYNVTIRATNAQGYDEKTLVWTVTPKNLTISGLTGNNKVYDRTTTATLGGTAVLNGVISGDAVSLSGTSVANFNNKDVGTGKPITVSGYTLSGAKAGNYTLTQPTGLTGNITKKSLTVTGATAQDKVYDGTTAATITGTSLVGVISPDVVTVSGGGTFNNANAGTNKPVTANLSLSGADAGNYSLTQPTGLTANITKANPVFTTSDIYLNVGGTYTLPGANISSTSDGTYTYSITGGGHATYTAPSTLNGISIGTETLTVNQAAATNHNAGSTTVTVVVTDFVYFSGDVRPLFAYTDLSYGGTSPYHWEEFNGTSWVNRSASPQNTKPSGRIIIDKEGIGGGGNASNTYNDIVITNGGELILYDNNASPSNFLNANKKITVEKGGILKLNGDIKLVSTNQLIVESEGEFIINNSSMINSHAIWGGVENFKAGSTVTITNWNWGAAATNSTLFQNSTTISSNAAGYKFGNLLIDAAPTSDWTLVGSSSLSNLKICENNLEIYNSGAKFISGTSNTTSSFIVGGDMIIYDGWFNFGTTFSGSSNFTNNYTINGDFFNISDDNFNLHYVAGGSSSGHSGTITIKGNIEIGSDVIINNTGNKKILLETGANEEPKFIDIAANVVRTNIDINNGYRRLKQDLVLGTNTRVTVKTGSTLDFGFNNNNTGDMALVIRRFNNDNTQTGQAFTLENGGTLKITSPEGITTGGTYTGNIQVGSNTTNRAFGTNATFHYIGKANQVSGNGVPNNLTGKLIVELDTNALTFNLSTSRTIASGGLLDIRKGLVIDDSSGGFNGEGDLTMNTDNGARFRLFRINTQPNLTGTYTLENGVVEFAGSSATDQTIRNTPNYKYQNIEVSGSNVGNSDGNIALRPNGSFIVKTDGIFTIRDRSIKCYNTIPGDLGAGTGCSVTVENNAVFQTGNSKGFSDYGSEFGSESSAVDANISNINLQNGSTVEYLGEKATGQIISRNTNVGQGTANYYNLTVSGDLVNKVEGLLEVNNIVEIKNHDTYTGKMVIKAVADNEAANVLIAKKGVITTDGGLVLENNAQLMQDEDANNYGHIRVERQFTFSDIFKQYNFVSAPVTNPDTDIRSSIYYPAIPQSVQEYHENDYYFYETNGPYIPGKGYAVQEVEGTTDEIGRFMGTPNNGNSLSFTLKKSTATGGFNLTGNPYPSNLNLNQLYTDNSDDIESTFYFWDNRGNTEFIQQGSGYNGDHYAKYNATNETGSAAAIGVPTSYETRIPTNEVKIGTGFMVQVKTGLDEGDYNLNFNNTQRITTNSGPGFFGKGQNFDQPQKDRYWLTMTTPGEIRVMNAVVYFDGGNDEFWLDDTKSFEGSDDLYTINDGHKLTIQGRAPFRINDVLPLGYKAFGTGTHIISVYQKEGIFAESQDIWLVDMLLNKTVNLSKKPYKFVTRAGEYGNRFKIVYRPSFQTGVDIHANDISMLKVGQQIEISSTIDRISEVEVFDLNSRPVFKKNEINHNKFIVNAISFNHQILIIKVKTETGETVTRKFVMN